MRDLALTILGTSENSNNLLLPLVGLGQLLQHHTLAVVFVGAFLQ